MTEIPFERSVFFNCPFDDAYKPLLLAIAFTVIDLNFHVRLAPEDADQAAARLARIEALILQSQFGIHDLSRNRSCRSDELMRFNMAFELGLDYGCRRFGDAQQATKAVLILEREPYETQRSLSDIAGWDISTHRDDQLIAMRCVRDWLVAKAGADRIPPTRISSDYATYQEWFLESELARGATEEDMHLYPVNELISRMRDWVAAGRPV